VKPLFEQLFKRYEGTEPKYSLECHGRTCRVESGINRDWIVDLQGLAPGREIFGGMMFSSPRGVNRVDTELNEEPVVQGKHLFHMIVFGAQDDILRCGAESTLGILTVRLVVTSAQLQVSVEGPLATLPFGECVRRALEAQVARGYVSPTLQVEPTVFPIVFPWKRREDD
jgi:hypothetical protein